jgi:hypothetical protein
MLSQYEQDRARNIASNKKLLRTLGLDRPILPEPDRSRVSKGVRTKSKQEAEPSQPARKSARLSVNGRNGEGSVRQNPPAALVPWEKAIFDECEQKGGGLGQAVFDGRRHHQHLTLSSSARSVATTGVAGSFRPAFA